MVVVGVLSLVLWLGMWFYFVCFIDCNCWCWDDGLVLRLFLYGVSFFDEYWGELDVC